MNSKGSLVSVAGWRKTRVATKDGGGLMSFRNLHCRMEENPKQLDRYSLLDETRKAIGKLQLTWIFSCSRLRSGCGVRFGGDRSLLVGAAITNHRRKDERRIEKH